MKPVVLTTHAATVVAERGLDIAWVERTANEPDWTMPDADPRLERRFKAVPERDGRMLRVVCYETDDAIYVVTAFLDRRARRPT